MILSGGKAGDPWHGLWRASTGKITAPDGAEVDLPGVAPSESTYKLTSGRIKGGQARQGECFLVRTKADEPAGVAGQEPGQTWLNYGLLSGAKHRLYGVAIGDYSWIYMAPDGAPWLATITTWGLSTTTWTIYPTLRLRPFGRVKVNGLTYSDEQIINLGGYTLGAFGEATSLTVDRTLFYLGIEDIRRDGARVMVGLFQDLTSLDGGWLSRVLCSPRFEISIDGQPGDGATATVTKLALDYAYTKGDVTSGDPVQYDTDSLGNPMTYIPSESWSVTHRIEVGRRYLPDGSLQLLTVTAAYQVQRSVTFTVDGSGYNNQGAIEVEGAFTLRGGDTVLDTIPFSVTGDVPYNYNGSAGTGTSTGSITVGSDTVTAERPSTEPAPAYALPAADVVSNIPRRFGIQYLGKSILFDVRTYTNSTVGWIRWATGDSSSRFGPVWGVVGANNQTISTSDQASFPLYVTEHPVTGEIVRRSTPVGWV